MTSTNKIINDELKIWSVLTNCTTENGCQMHSLTGTTLTDTGQPTIATFP